MYPFLRPNPLQQILDAVNGGQELPVAGGGYASPYASAGTSTAPVGRMAELESIISRPQPFERQQEQPEATKRQRVLAAIKDAIAGYVEGRTGRPVSYAGAQDRIRATRERNKQIREQNRLGEARSIAEGERQSALLEYQRLQQEKELGRQAGEKSAAELRGLQGEALDLGFDPGQMTAEQIRSAIPGKRSEQERRKEGRQLLLAMAEQGLEVTEEAARPLLAGEPSAIEHGYRALGLTTQARGNEKFEQAKELAGIKKPTPKPDQTAAKNAAAMKKKAEEVMKGLAGYVGGVESELKSGKITPDEVRSQLQAALDARGLDAESAAADESVAAERQRVINFFAKRFVPILRKYDANVRIGG